MRPPLQGSVFSVENGNVYLYDTILPIEPFSYTISPKNITKNISFLDSINKEKILDEYTEGNIITYYFHNSYMKVYERIKDNYYILMEFLILDKGIKLRNDIKVGMNRNEFNIIYPEAKQYANLSEIYMVEESEFTCVGCFFKSDTIYKITFYNVELESQLSQ